MSTDAAPDDRAGRADARSQKAAQAERERQVVRDEIAADTRRVEENTARLKALRLAKQEADAAVAAQVAAEKAAAKLVKKPVKRRKPA